MVSPGNFQSINIAPVDLLEGREMSPLRIPQIRGPILVRGVDCGGQENEYPQAEGGFRGEWRTSQRPAACKRMEWHGGESNDSRGEAVNEFYAGGEPGLTVRKLD